MPTFAAGALSPQNVVLGLLSEERGTAAALALRIGERLPEAGFPRNAAHTAVKNLLEKDDRVRVANPGAESSKLLYEAAAEGLLDLQRWIRSSPKLPLVVRDPVQAKLEFVQPHDLPILLKRLEEEEDALTDQRHEAHKSLLDHGPVRKDAPWDVRLRSVQERELVLLLRLMSAHRATLREHIEAYLAAFPGLVADRGEVADLRPNTHELTPQLIALGLVSQQADTPAGVAARLGKLFKATRYAKTSVYENLRSLERDGLVCVIGGHLEGPEVDRPTRLAIAVEDGTPQVEECDPESPQPSYQATPAGAAYIRAWVCSPPSIPPGVRDVLRGKVQFVRPEELPVLLKTIRKEERAFTKMCNLAHASLLEEDSERRESAKRRRPGSPFRPWRDELRYIRTFHEANLWQMMSDRRAKLHEDLQLLAATVDCGASQQRPRSARAEAS
jgi:hypothetical protein